MTPISYFVVSGMAFFVGVLMLFTAAVVPVPGAARWAKAACGSVVLVGAVLIALSATPLPLWFYGVWAAVTLAWLLAWGLRSRLGPRLLTVTRCLAVVACCAALALELPWHDVPALRRPDTLFVIGDSLSGPGAATSWPEWLQRLHNVKVVNLSQPGATIKAAMVQPDQLPGPATVLVVVGRNDALGATTGKDFEFDLGILLSGAIGLRRTVAMLELPLPLFGNRFGLAQRRLARLFHVRLVPKRVLAGVLAAPGASADGIHLTEAGQRLMADAVWALYSSTGQPAAARSRRSGGARRPGQEAPARRPQAEEDSGVH